MARRLGLRTLRTVAYNFCRYYVRFHPALALVYAGNPALLAAMDAVNAACGTFVGLADEEFEPGV